MDIQITHMYQRNSDDQGPDRRQDSYNPSNGDNANSKDAIFHGQDITGDFKNPISLTSSNGIPGLANQYHLTQIPNGDPNLIPLLNTYHVQFQAKPVPGNNGFLIVL